MDVRCGRLGRRRAILLLRCSAILRDLRNAAGAYREQHASERECRRSREAPRRDWCASIDRGTGSERSTSHESGKRLVGLSPLQQEQCLLITRRRGPKAALRLRPRPIAVESFRRAAFVKRCQQPRRIPNRRCGATRRTSEWRVGSRFFYFGQVILVDLRLTNCCAVVAGFRYVGFKGSTSGTPLLSARCVFDSPGSHGRETANNCSAATPSRAVCTTKW